MSRGRAAGYDTQREAILTHAARLFAERGYPATSMNEVAQACGLSKATLYHYYRDKYALLVHIAEGHVAQLEALVEEVQALQLAPADELRTLILRIVAEYAGARHAHQVLTEDVRFLTDADRDRVLGGERRVVAAVARAIALWQPAKADAGLATPLTMLLFGMMNWLFTWMQPDRGLNHEAIAPIIADLFTGGVIAVQPPSADTPAPAGAKAPVPTS